MNSDLIASEPPASAALSFVVVEGQLTGVSPEPKAPVERPAKLAMLCAPVSPETGEMNALRSESTSD